MSADRIEIGSPWFEDLRRGQVFDEAPAVTLTAGHAAFHQAVYGDRLRLPLDIELARAVTGRETALAHRVSSAIWPSDRRPSRPAG